MKSRIGWIIAGILLLVVLVGLPLLSGFGGFGCWGGYGGMMGGFGPMHGYMFSPLGWVGMISMWLIPLGLLTLLVVCIVWLFGALTRGGWSLPAHPPAAPARACPSCSKPAQADWSVCPYCGNALS